MDFSLKIADRQKGKQKQQRKRNTHTHKEQQHFEHFLAASRRSGVESQKREREGWRWVGGPSGVLIERVQECFFDLKHTLMWLFQSFTAVLSAFIASFWPL